MGCATSASRWNGPHSALPRKKVTSSSTTNRKDFWNLRRRPRRHDTGAAGTAPVAALVPFGVSVGLTAGSVVATGLNNNASDITRMTASSADEIVRYLSEFFAKLGGIKADQVMKARIRY